MRAKNVRHAQRPAEREVHGAPQPMAQWLLQVELGWGLPHFILALPGLIMICFQAVDVALDRWYAERHPARESARPDQHA